VSRQPVYELKGGRWFTGDRFVERVMWTVDGTLTDHRPAHIDSVLDLTGEFVIPPFAEAHTHNIGCPPTPAEAATYIASGILYVWNMGTTFPVRANEPAQPVEVTCASPPLTGQGSHLVLLNERSALRGNFPGLGPTDLDGKTHVLIDSAADVARKLDAVLDARPAFVKVILAFSEDYERRKNDSTFVGKRGLDPALLREIVRRAHARHIQVAAHVETAADFRVALAAGVDIIAHLPGLRIGEAAGYPGETSIARYLLTPDDAQRAHRQRTIVITTAIASRALRTNDSTATRIREIHARNASLLMSHHATLIIGSDLYAGTVVDEALLLGQDSTASAGLRPLGLFDNRSLLRLWTMDTPRAMFPTRRIGSLTSRSEANLVVLAGDPLSDLSNVRRVRRVMKAGRIVN
jgi:imidazolonepropionase-like amidohydrolase